MVLAILTLVSMTSQAQLSSDSILRREMTDFGIRFTDDNTVHVLKSGQAKFDDLFHSIKGARQSIHLEYFNFRNDSIASLLFNLLREKRRQGVEVRALFDGFGNDSNNRPLLRRHIKALRQDSIEIYEYDPIRFPWLNHIWPRDHRKIVVIDGEIGYTGGMNVADYYINGTEQVGEWRDLHCRIQGSAVNDLQTIFREIWYDVTGEYLNDSKYFRGKQSGKMTVGILNREPGAVYLSDGHLLGRNDAIRRFYISAIDAARDSINLINPYLTLLPSISKTLDRALKRGVRLNIMISAKSDIPLTPDCVFYNAHRFMKRGAQVWIYQPGFHHSKIMMVDGRFCTIGSSNLNSRSLRFDYEDNAIILNKDITAELDAMFNHDKENSVLMTQNWWKKERTAWQRFRAWFAHLLAFTL
jgi:cardiolipin synthase